MLRMLTVLVLSCTSLVSAPAFAARNIDVCIRMAQALNEMQNTFDQNKIAVANAKYICEGRAPQCESDLSKRLDRSIELLASAQTNYRNAGCEDDSVTSIR